MPTGARINVADSKRLRAFLRRLDPDQRDSVSAEVLEGLTRVAEADAKENQIVRGRGKQAPPLPDKLTYRSGELSRSISTDFSRLPKVAVLGTRLRYGAVHELGIPPYPKRAFLEPAVRTAIRQKGEALFRRAFDRLPR